MKKLECCRTCLSPSDLKPIFDECKDYVSYSNDLFETTGIRIQKDDMVSQLMCSPCKAFIASSLDFRRKCKESNERFYKLINGEVKIEVDITPLSDDEYATESVDEKNLKIIEDNLVEHEGSLDDFLKISTEVFFANVEKHNRANLSFLKEPMEGEQSTAVRYPRKCPKCPRLLYTKRAYDSHLCAHGVKLVCEYCGKEVKDTRALLCHYKAKHGHEKTDKCRFCDYRGTKMETVKIHERTHTGEKPYVCATCGAGFHRKSSYTQHVPLHLPDKTVKCDLCPAMFKSITLMQIHRSNRHRRKKEVNQEEISIPPQKEKN